MKNPTAICWHCSKKLLAKNKVMFMDQAGNEHLVHKWCLGYMGHIFRQHAFNNGARRVGAKGGIK